MPLKGGRLLPAGGRRRTCRECGIDVSDSWVETSAGMVFCPEHGRMPFCQTCSMPCVSTRYQHPIGQPLCDACGTTVIKDREQVRKAVPGIKQQLTRMSITLPVPVRVELKTKEEVLRKLPSHAGGITLGLTAISIGPAGQRSVLDIWIIAGLPYLEFGATLAHEAGHAWAAQAGFPPLEPGLEEGWAELVAYGWLKQQGTDLAELLRERRRTRMDPVYGDGFRLVLRAAEQHGVNAVMTSLKTKGALPTAGRST